MRVDYPAPTAAPDESAVADGWLPLLESWIDEAATAGLTEPNAMVLATVDAQCRPSARTVLCKGIGEDGLRWFTNHDSDKGQELAARPYASVTFPWLPFYRQFHARGPVSRLGAEEVLEYWRARPRGAQLGAWASAQSRPVASRAALQEQYAVAAARFDGVDAIPVPPYWGGYLLTPERAEFWQGGHDRMHHRIQLTRVDEGWDVQRLQP